MRPSAHLLICLTTLTLFCSNARAEDDAALDLAAKARFARSVHYGFGGCAIFIAGAKSITHRIKTSQVG